MRVKFILIAVGVFLMIPVAAQTLQRANDPVIAAAGDIACDPADSDFGAPPGTDADCREMETSDLLVGGGLAAVLPLGDIQYPCANVDAINASYDPSWGRVKDISYPAIGNHEYSEGSDPFCDGEATDYFDYFGDRAGDPSKAYYSYDIGNWHIVALNSNCSRVGGCGPGSPQEQWLRADLAANPAQCTLAYWHHPRWSSGTGHGSDDRTDGLVTALYEAGAEVVLSGHDHDYERFAPQDPNGTLDIASGLRQFVVGTGGKSVHELGAPIANSEVGAASFGVLKLTLRPNSYDWNFESIPSESFADSGTTACHNAAATAPETTIETGPPSQTPNSDASFSLSADAPDVTYECSLDGAPFSTCTSPVAYKGLVPGPHLFRARATDSDGNTDPTPAAWSWTIDPTGNRLTLLPEADATVKSGSPDTNFGSDLQLEADSSPPEEALVRFTVDGLTEPPQSAVLRLLVSDSSSDGPALFMAENSWSESSVTWATQPSRTGDMVGDLGSARTGEWVQYDVTSVVGTNGTYTFNLVGESANGTDFHSREAGGEMSPELVIELGEGSPLPETTIDSGPPADTNSTSATFTFSSSQPGSTFDCSLDGAAFTPCSSPTTYTELADGLHSFAVRATDGLGNADPTPATWSWTVERVVTNMTFTPEADATVAAANPDRNFGSEVTLEADLSPEQRSYVMFSVTDVSETVTQATLRVRASEGTSDGPVLLAVETDWIEDAVTWNSRPNRLLATPIDDSARILAGEWVEFDVTSIVTGNGSYAFELSPESSNGATFASREAPPIERPQLIVHTSAPPDTQPPETSIDSAPPDPTNTTMAVFAFSADETGSSFECSIDNTPFTSCTSPKTYAGLTDGDHSFAVRATDLTGNTDATPATHTWTIDISAPTTPAGLAAVGVEATEVSMVWGASTDNVGVVAYDIYRNGNLHDTVGGATTSYQDTTVTPDTGYSYYVVARDAANNTSLQSNTINVITPGQPSQLTLVPTDDATIRQNRPDRNLGSRDSLEVDGDLREDTLLRFDVVGVGGSDVVSATLRLYVTNGSSNGGDWRATSNTNWSEDTVTWNLAPVADGVSLGNVGSVSVGTWVEIDMLALVSGDGVVSIRGSSTNPNGADYVSTEGNPAFAPQLIITLDEGSAAG